MSSPMGNLRETIDLSSLSEIKNMIKEETELKNRKIKNLPDDESKSENSQVRTDIVSSKLMKLLGNRMDKIVYIRKTLFLKYAYLRQLTVNFQVSIIIASTIITFLESLNGHLPMSNSHIQVSSIILSTYIAISTSVIKFLKIDDKKEEVYKLMETFSNHEKQIHIKKDKIKFINSRCEDTHDFNVDPSMNIQEEFISIYREIHDENLIHDLYESISRYDSLISYKDKLYYKGKIVENMLLERVHNNNFDYIMNDDNLRKEGLEKEDAIGHYESNFCNNFCLYFSWFCNFCLVMKLYYFLDRKRNKENKVGKEKKICKVVRVRSFNDNNHYDIECGCLSPPCITCCTTCKPCEIQEVKNEIIDKYDNDEEAHIQIPIAPPKTFDMEHPHNESSI